MTQRIKRVLTVGITLVILFGLLYIVAYILLTSSFATLERDETRRNVQRVLNAITNEQENLSVTAADWSSWDDTYKFVLDHNDQYIESNLIDSTLYTLQLNLMLFVDTSGEVVYEKSRDLETQEPLAIGDALAEHLTVDGLLLHERELTATISGIVQLPDQSLLLVAAYPILNSMDQGPARGTLIFGRVLDEYWLDRIAESVQLDVAFQGWNSPDLAPQIKALESTRTSESTIAIQAINDQLICGYTAITDVYGNPVMLIRVDIARDIYQQGQTTLTYFGIALNIIGVLFGFFVLFLLEQNHLVFERFAIILNNSSDAICLVRPDGKIVQTNPAFDRVFVSTLTDSRRQFKNLFDPESIERLTNAFDHVINHKQHSHLDAIALDHTQEPLNVDVLLSPVVRGDNRVSGLVCSFHDITAQKQTEEQLRKALAHEIQLSTMKAQFVSMASHELRTPLTEIKLEQEFLDRYASGLDPDKLKQKLTAIGASVLNMQLLLEDVLTLSSVESNQFRYNPEPLDVAQLCQELANSLMATIGYTNRIALKTDGDLKNLNADPRLLRHILENLLSNALKYSPEDSTVNFTVTAAIHEIIFTIQDQGIGIPASERPHVFDMFFRGERVANIPGTGLGLAIVKQAVDVHGGTIMIESNEEVGTSVIVRLPITGSRGK